MTDIQKETICSLNFEPIVFDDFEKFKPTLRPDQIIRLGSFGGIYFNTDFPYNDWYKELPSEWFKDLKDFEYCAKDKDYNKNVNLFKVKAGTSQKDWEKFNWINPLHPRGWFQWYCYFYNGHRTSDDFRQISRWLDFCGPNGRWLKTWKKGYNNNKESKVIRQSLLHWACWPVNVTNVKVKDDTGILIKYDNDTKICTWKNLKNSYICNTHINNIEILL